MTFEINPEFRRNLWLQFGWQRLAAALIVGVTMAYAIYIIGGLDRLSYAANLAAAIILGMWG
ncbi:MAG: hypothetical protein JNL25_08125, partial [Rhodospirillaceae bacterium]|nr:hypothetical protein [Rhodospirillaceae bacterium]